MNDERLKTCEASRWLGERHRCRWCNAELRGRQQRWCSDACSMGAMQSHWWTWARDEAMRSSNGKCLDCGRPAAEVHHIEPCMGAHDKTSCAHHQSNLRPLCRRHHLLAHQQLRNPAHAGQLEIGRS